jgi:hypothetical protein
VCIPCRENNRPKYDPIKGKEYNELYSERRKDRRLKKRYMISIDQYKEILLKQNSLCGICKISIEKHQERKGSKKQFAVDHCHKTGAIRGLLCYRCNMGLGYFQDNPDFTQSATNYLIKN